MKKHHNITLYAATQKVWGADHPRFIYFDTMRERNTFVQTTDYADIAGTVHLTEEQYQQWKRFGEWYEE